MLKRTILTILPLWAAWPVQAATSVNSEIALTARAVMGGEEILDALNDLQGSSLDPLGVDVLASHGPDAPTVEAQVSMAASWTGVAEGVVTTSGYTKLDNLGGSSGGADFVPLPSYWEYTFIADVDGEFTLDYATTGSFVILPSFVLNNNPAQYEFGFDGSRAFVSGTGTVTRPIAAGQTHTVRIGYITWSPGSGGTASTQLNMAGTFNWSFDSDVTAGPILPTPTVLHPNAPNPFNPTTTISFDLRRPSRVRLRVLDAVGRPVVTLIEGQPLAAGPHQVLWHGRDARGHDVASGVYFYSVRAGDDRMTRKMTLLR